ncbi:hypothetical protein HC723_04390 [Vibrio sp. S11_S32]|uniref:hypothetical protein n=1 Tax=Vibrio sp. S11_S32 TaxID=2720225 RepID=UPI001680D5EB|nr:hypothetical protein [Vibrio sp. S11_S32]MBD1575691.1 hypothetical protein [Vibrio sp. S11_S32]
MVSAKEFASWLKNKFLQEKQGVTLSREDIMHLTGRQSFNLDFVHDTHYELMRFNIAFVTDTAREHFFLIPLTDAKNWRETLERQFEKELYCNIYPIERSG